MGQPATLVVDIETVGQDPDGIPARAREILLDVETDEDRQRVLDGLGLDPCTGSPTGRSGASRGRVIYVG